MTPTGPAIRLSPPMLVAVIMLALLAELLLYAAGGLVVWLVINAVAAVAAGLVMWLVRRRRAARRANPSTTTRTPTAGRDHADRPRRHPVGRLGSLLPGARRGTPGADRPGGLGNLLRGRHPQQGQPRGGLLGGLGRGAPRPSGGRAGAGLPGWLTGGARGPAGAGRSGFPSFARPAAGGARPGPRSGRPGGSTSQPGRRPTSGPSPWQQFRAGVRDGAQPTSRPAGSKPSPHPRGKTGRAAAPEDLADKKPATTRPATPAGREPAAKKEQPMTQSTNIRFDDDASLQRWGRNLGTIAPAIDEAGTSANALAELAGGLAAAVRKVASQGDTDLPADRQLVAEAETLGHDLADVQREMEALHTRLRSLSGRAEELGRCYWRHHEVDEARVNGERGGRHKEKRADVSAAEQDI